jgi:hypothetical protein
MKTKRLTTVTELVRYWPFISKGLQEIAVKADEKFDLDSVYKTMMWLVTDQIHTWIGLSFNDDFEPAAFGVAQECTPPFDLERKFVVRWFYHSAGQFQATVHLMTSFETWARAQGVSSYGVTTRRDSGSAIRCFQSPKYGFRRSHVTFEKHLN